MIDFHGSTGYGQAFTDSISGDWGGKPLEDLKLGLDAALKAISLAGRRSRVRARRILRRLHDELDRGPVAGSLQVPGQPRRHLRQSHHVLLHRGTMVSRVGDTAAPNIRIPPATPSTIPIDYVDQVEDADAGDSRPAGLSRARLTRAWRCSRPCSAAAFRASCCTFPNENHWVLKPADSIQWYDTVLGVAQPLDRALAEAF